MKILPILSHTLLIRIFSDIIGIDVINFSTDEKTNFIFLGLLISLNATFYSCEKEDGGEKVTYSLSGTSWIYSDEEDGGENTFEFTNEQSVSFTQDWIDTGVEFTETKEGTYSYSHPSVSITVGSKEYSGTVDGESMNIGGFLYKKQ